MARNTNPARTVIRQVRDRDGWACVVCSGTNGLQTHHRRTRGMGGTRRPDTNEPQNLITVCHVCHHRIEMNRADSYRHGLLVHQSEDPAAVPVHTWRGVVFLKADGRFRAATV